MPQESATGSTIKWMCLVSNYRRARSLPRGGYEGDENNFGNTSYLSAFASLWTACGFSLPRCGRERWGRARAAAWIWVALARLSSASLSPLTLLRSTPEKDGLDLFPWLASFMTTLLHDYSPSGLLRVVTVKNTYNERIRILTGSSGILWVIRIFARLKKINSQFNVTIAYS